MATLNARDFLPVIDTPPQTATLGFIPEGTAGVRATLDLMIQICKAYRKQPAIRAFAENLLRDVPAKDSVGEVRAMFDYVQKNIRYTQDVRDVETIKTPDATIYSGMGDCDDMSLLVSTLCETIGYATRFVAVGMADPSYFEHVYSEVKLGTVWVAMDTIVADPLGWHPKKPACIMVRHV